MEAKPGISLVAGHVVNAHRVHVRIMKRPQRTGR